MSQGQAPPPRPSRLKAGTYHDDQQGRGHKGPDGPAVEGQPAAAEGSRTVSLSHMESKPRFWDRAPGLVPSTIPSSCGSHDGRLLPLEMWREVATGVKSPRLRPECRPRPGAPAYTRPHPGVPSGHYGAPRCPRHLLTTP